MIGTTLSHYKILEKIGQGGMGEVYRAEDTNLSREVAIKVLPEQFTQDPQRLARFEREAKLLASLNHPNIAAIYGFEHSDDVHFLVLELVEGETLAEQVAKGPLPVEEALEVCRQIAEGVEAAHEKGVIHRDLKPANVKITPEGTVKILDFGLAKAFQEEISPADISQSPTLTEEMTRAGVILGTAAYMSPEQAKGKPLDKRADIFAFGCVLYELLTAKRTFQGETITETLGAIIHKEPAWDALPGTTPGLIRSLLRRCLQKDQDRRLRDIGDAKIEIEEALTEPTALQPAGTVQLGGQRWAMTIGLVVLSAAVVGMTIWIWMQPAPPEQRLNKFVITPSSTAPLARSLTNDLAISPDGRHFVYLATGQTNVQLYLRSLDDFVDRPIPGTEGAEGGSFFSPDGESVGFFAQGKLKKVALSGGSPITLCDASATGFFGSWGSDDTIVFRATINGDPGLYRVSATGGEPETLTIPNPDQGENAYLTPQILPDGKAVLFSIRLGLNFQTAVLSLDTGEQKIVVEDSRQAHYLPTGHLIYEQPGTGNLMVVPFDLATFETAGKPVPVLQGVRQNVPGQVDYAISENGTLVYVPSQTDDVQRLVWVDRKGTESLIIQDEVSFGSPRISPNGKQVALALSKGGEEQNLWIYNLEVESLRRLTFQGGSVESWSPDGKWIIFQGRPREGERAV
ncbi:protein kinase, partial [Acidobacteria bacterium AH-259-D05]|nr:protein kinase [Acidobacteria bacterium AH-259-D05]